MGSMAACAFILAFLDCDPARQVDAEDWPRWRGPRGDGTWRGPALPEKWPAGGLKRVWRQEIGGGYAGVSAAEGRVLTMDRVTQPDEVERVLCFEAVTGKLLWKHQYPVAYGKLDYGNGPRAAPTVFERKVYTLGAVGQVCCLNAATGEVIWSHDMIREFAARQPEWGFAASPVIFDNLVVIHTGAEPNGCYIAFDRHTGKEVWRSLTDPAGYCTPIVIEHAGRQQLVCWTPENVCGLDPHTGGRLWSVPYKVTMGVSIATPIFHDGIVFASGYWEGSKAIRLGREPAGHSLAWEETRWLRGLMSQPLVRGGYAYLLDKHHGLVCFELATGKKIWDDGNQMTPRGRNPQASMVWLTGGGVTRIDRRVGRVFEPHQNRPTESRSLAVVGLEDSTHPTPTPATDRAIILNSDGELILARINPTGYHEQSRTNIIRPTERGPIWAHPAYAGTHVYVRSDAELLCVSLLDAAN